MDGSDAASAGRRARRAPDARLVVGVVLVLASVVGTWLLVDSLDRTIRVYAAPVTLVPGETVRLDEFDVVDVRLGASEALYLAASGDPGERIVLRTVREGELVPAAALGDASADALATVVISPAGELPTALGAGSVVDLWSAEAVDRGAWGPPSVLVPRAVVQAIARDDAGVGGLDRTPSVELAVPRDAVPAVLAAIAAGDAMHLVGARAGGAG
ncbi:hypothetical protein ARHIZOSPH14_02910 [Agromyces rhizosphaerae]|uniref:SAF domain-containing protein n=1 Tax=Agromyces rhizosphaerae TaxID=88374 RepID=A0A9W6CVF1_9MICO|nr:hypothetical protein [Agromyces rhizosphaerae]GLI26049.1 hypothetical protein ARHIZOSPH14_02910 [Agromyces rhizosphaerae]